MNNPSGSAISSEAGSEVRMPRLKINLVAVQPEREHPCISAESALAKASAINTR